MHSIFYSWQADLPSATNRGFIRDALERAVKRLKQHPSILEPIRKSLEVETGTDGCVGAEDIAAAIFETIDKCDICVFDVSIVIRNKPNDTSTGDSGDAPLDESRSLRPTPNPNVLIELGYALHAHGTEGVLLVCNTAFGTPEELPFDIRPRLTITYHSSPTDKTRSASKETLTSALLNAIVAIYTHNEKHKFTRNEMDFFSSLVATVGAFLDNVSEELHRRPDPAISIFSANCTTIASQIHQLETYEVPRTKSELLSQMRRLAESLEQIGRWQHVMGSDTGFETSVDAAVDLARSLIEPCPGAARSAFASFDLNGETKRALNSAIDSLGRFVAAVEKQDMSATNTGRGDLAHVGREFQVLGRWLSCVEDPDGDVLSRFGHVLHALEHRGTEELGFRPEHALLPSLKAMGDELTALGKIRNAKPS